VATSLAIVARSVRLGMNCAPYMHLDLEAIWPRMHTWQKLPKQHLCVNPLDVRAFFSTSVFPTKFFGMEFLVRRTGGGS
jgi:hypothetical protein